MLSKLINFFNNNEMFEISSTYYFKRTKLKDIGKFKCSDTLKYYYFVRDADGFPYRLINDELKNFIEDYEVEIWFKPRSESLCFNEIHKILPVYLIDRIESEIVIKNEFKKENEFNKRRIINT